VVAMDIQAGMLQRTRARAQAANLGNIRYVQGGIGEGRLAHAEYDRAVLVTVLGEIPDRRSALKEVFEALKPGGLLVVTELIADPHFQRRSTVRKLAGAAGFREHSCSGNRVAYTLSLIKPGAA
jgi:ubiquinone/menaquinone biosynthesis C-methylase UbiE